MIEFHYSKQEILLAYINEVYLTQSGTRSIHGFGLGAQHFFGSSLKNLDTAIKKQGDLLEINEKLVITLDKIEKRVQKSNENTVGELQLITKTLIDEISKNTQANIDNNKKLNDNLKKLNKSNSRTISKAIQQISNKAIYKQIVANQAIQAQQISKLVKQNNSVLGKIADKTSRIKYP